MPVPLQVGQFFLKLPPHFQQAAVTPLPAHIGQVENVWGSWPCPLQFLQTLRVPSQFEQSVNFLPRQSPHGLEPGPIIPETMRMPRTTTTMMPMILTYWRASSDPALGRAAAAGFSCPQDGQAGSLAAMAAPHDGQPALMGGGPRSEPNQHSIPPKRGRN